MITDFSDLATIERIIDSVDTTLKVKSTDRDNLIKAIAEVGFLPIAHNQGEPSSVTLRRVQGRYVTKLHLSRNQTSFSDNSFCYVHKKSYAILDVKGKEINHREDKKPYFISYHPTNCPFMLRFLENGQPIRELSWEGMDLINVEAIEMRASNTAFRFYVEHGLPSRLTLMKEDKRTISKLKIFVKDRSYSQKVIETLLPEFKSLSLQEKLNLQKYQPQLLALLEMLIYS